MGKIKTSIQDILGPDGALAGSLQGFEFRSSQMEMALLIQEALEKNRPAIVEAGTGTGKTFGYLVPVVLTGKKAVISTGTKTLQEQIFLKDIPLLSRISGLKIDAMLMKGRKNYLCLYRYHQHFSQESLLGGDAGGAGKKIEKWLGRTEFADLAELSWLSDNDPLWDQLSSSSEQCLGSKCPFLDECYLGRLRSRAAGCSIIIVNHYLFFADLKVKEGGFGEIIPRFQVAVFDEAHRIEEIATTYLGENLSAGQLTELAADLEKHMKAHSLTNDDGLKGQINKFKSSIEYLKKFFEPLEERGRIEKPELEVLSRSAAKAITGVLDLIIENRALNQAAGSEGGGLLARAENLKENLDQIITGKGPEWLHWYEKRKHNLMLFSSPLNISSLLKELLYCNLKSVVFTSATLSTNSNFDYIRSRLGIPPDALEGIYPSHFEFKHRTLLYIPRDLPVPNSVDFPEKMADRIKDILYRSNGRALVLFTSYQNLNLVHKILEGKIPFTVLKQGEAPRSVLLEEFRKDINSILLATGAFWQGVDVPGEALSCLIVDKLPFDSPGDPLVAARVDAIKAEGRNAFIEYQVPSAVITLKQGLGRLIRKSSDRGIFSVLDTRILKSRYGVHFLRSLPEIPMTHEIAEIDKFFRDSS